MTLTASASVFLSAAPVMVVPDESPLWVIRGDEELEEYHHASRTAPVNDWPDFRHPCTPSVVRFYKSMVDKSGDFRVNVSPMLGDYLALNGETKITDPKTRYFFGERTALFNGTGYPRQAYTTMQGNQLRGERVGEWLRFETLTPDTMLWREISHKTHPHLIHRFDLVCYKDKQTHHKPTTPQGQIFYFLTTVEGFGYIPVRYVRRLDDDG